MLTSRTLTLPPLLLTVAALAYAAPAEYPSGLPSPEAVKAVESGALGQADVSWWGFDEEDSTDALQAALDSGAAKVTIPYMGKPWITRPLTMRSNQEIYLEPGVVVLAKKGEFRGRGDSLFRATDESNITFRGYGATLRMRKRDYQQPPYERAEWRMGLSFNGCTNILVEGVRIESSGGDGIYAGATGQQAYCKDMTVRNVTCHDNHRQGISVIGAENLLIEGCTFSNTWGTAPGAGIDLEPDGPHERLVNILIKDCVFENNEGHEVLVYLKNLDETTPPVSVRFERCIARKTVIPGDADAGIGQNDMTHGSAGFVVGASRDNGPDGLVEFVNCVAENNGKESVKVFDKSANKVKVRFVNCRFKNPWQTPHPAHSGIRAPVFLEVRRPHLSEHAGGVEFVDCHLWDEVNRPVVMLLPFNSDYGVHDITGRIWVHSAAEPRMWLGYESTGIGLELVQIDPEAEPEEQKPGADAE